jgi:hypothetical protein
VDLNEHRVGYIETKDLVVIAALGMGTPNSGQPHAQRRQTDRESDRRGCLGRLQSNRCGISGTGHLLAKVSAFYGSCQLLEDIDRADHSDNHPGWIGHEEMMDI